MLGQYAKTLGKTILNANIREEYRLLTAPDPSAHAFVHSEPVELPSWLIAVPVMGNHALLEGVIKRKIQEVALRHRQKAGSKLLKQAFLIVRSNDQIGEAQQLTLAIRFALMFFLPRSTGGVLLANWSHKTQ